MKKSIAHVRRLLVILSAVCATISAHGQPSQFEGEWVNMDEETSDITKLLVTTTGDTVKVRVFGRCHPIDCDWG